MTEFRFAENRIRLMVAADRQTLLVRTGWAAIVISAASAWFVTGKYSDLPELPAAPINGHNSIENAEWKTPAPLIQSEFGRFRAFSGPGSPAKAGLEARFRLAGTFFRVDGEGKESRMAVIDDLEIRRQSIVRENDQIDEDLTVKSILTDRVIVRTPRGDENLWLSFPGFNGANGHESQSQDESEFTKDAKNRFGRRTGKRSWVYERKALMDYYDELMDNPDRLLTVFDSMKPVYTKDKRITGYRLGLEGEPEFFEAMGIREGDVVRRVNSMDMTNRRRCEYLIGQFVKNRSNAFVVDIERKGKRIRQSYVVR